MANPVQLEVDGVPPSGLKDSFGRLIDGDDNGQPGGNAIAMLSRGGVTIDAVASAQTSLHATTLLSAVVDALLERNALAGMTRTTRGHLDYGLLREARE